MSEAKKQYEKVMTANDEYISMSIDNRKIRAYVSELEQEKAELKNLLQSLWNIAFIPQKYEEKGKMIYSKIIEFDED